MKVLLFQLNYDVHVIHPPLGLGYLAAYLRKKKHEVSIFDGTLKNATLKDYLWTIENFKPNLVGITVLSRGHNKAKQLIKTIKGKFNHLPIVIGGTQVTAAPREVVADLGADFGVVGEGEITLFELAQALAGKRKFSLIDGLVYKDKGELVKNKPRELTPDLDALPFPAWDLMPPAQYRIAPILEPAKAFPIAPVMTSRGCPYNCSFCASNATWQRKIRFRSPENVLAEIKILKQDFGAREIHFADDNFTMDIGRAEKICDLMIGEKINLPWQCPSGVRIDRLPLSLLVKMKKSGCYAVGLGIESADKEILRKASKNLDLKIVPRVLKDLKKLKIESYGFFILGLPGETRKTIKKTIDFALKNDFDRAWFNLFTPYPGSPAFDSWIGNRKLSEIDWDKHDCSTAVAKVGKISARELEKWQKKALLEFYLRPRILFKFLIRLRTKELTAFFMSRFFKSLRRQAFPAINQLA